ncbi:MAG: response regulator [Victivallales bacterium]|nr:response regulator [Victivallales bacterium]MBR5023567.1 response regulator [Victivallales bacterium]
MKSNTDKFIFLCMVIAGFIWMILGSLLIYNTINVFKDYSRVETSQRHYYDYSEAARMLQKGGNTLTEQARLYAITHDLRYLLGYFREKFTYRNREQAIKLLGNIPETTELKRLIIVAVSESRTLEYTEYRSMNLVIAANGYDRSILPADMEKQLSSNPLSESDRNLSKEEKLVLARKILFDGNYQKRKKDIWADVDFHMGKMLEDTEYQYLINSLDIARRYRNQIIYLSCQTLILLSLLLYAFIVNRQRQKVAKELEGTNIHLVHEKELVKQESEMKLQQTKLEAQLAAQELEVKLKQKELEDRNLLFAAISHDMRTPLHSIIGFTDLLRSDNDLPANQKDHLDSIAYSGGILLELINDLLDFFKLEAGKMEFNYDYYDFQKIIKPIVKTFKPITDAKKLQIITNIAEMPALYIDMEHVRRILSNLLSNAVKFTSDGTITISASCEDSGPDTKTLVFAVQDTGIGIDPEDLAILTQPYMQGKAKSNVKGTGLGLAICKTLLGNMQGSLDIKSDKGKGSTFTVTLNNVKYSAQPIERDENASNQLKASLKGLSVLMVDDTSLNLKMLKIMCEKLGITKTQAAKNGKEALDILRSQPLPDIVMTDIQMPIMDGMGLVAEIRKDATLANLPVYAVTADVELLKTYQRHGFTGLLLKPYDITKLIQFFNKIS